MKKFLLFIFCIMVCASVAYARLSATSFPKTIDDLSFSGRMALETESYKPFLDKQTYQDLNVVPGEEIFTDHMIATMESEAKQQEQDAKMMNITEYCAKYPFDEKRCPQATNTPQQNTNTVSTQPTPTPIQTQSQTPVSTPVATASSYSGYTIGGGPVIENNIVVGGSCYPADHDRWYKNIIYTTGKFEKQFPALEKGLITLFRKEGGCGTIKNDPCGYTCYGIGSGPRCMGIVVKSRAEAEDVYYKYFWDKYKLYKLPDVISADIFLAGVGSGMGTALQNFRVFLGLKKRAAPVDDELVNAVKNYNGDIHNKWMDLRQTQLRKVAARRYNNKITYDHAIEIKRKNGCHVRPQKPLYRQ